MDTKVIPITKPVQEAWAKYIQSQQRAQRTLRMEDGIKAGRDWARWLELFTPSSRVGPRE